MTSATVPLAGGRLRDTGVVPATAVTELFDPAQLDGLDLPCQSGNPDLWFADAPTDLERAKQLCVGCPVRVECLSGALARHEPWGVWGGEIFERGAVVARKRPRGRPRKEDKARERVEARPSARAQEAAA